MTKMSIQKFKYLTKKRAFKMKSKAFFNIFKGLSLKEIKINFFGSWESDFKGNKPLIDKVPETIDSSKLVSYKAKIS